MILISKMHKTTNLIFDIRLVETKKSKLSTLTSTRRDINGSTHETRRNKNNKSHILRNTIRNYHRNRSFFWSYYWFYLTRNHSHLSKLCSRSYVIYCIWRINTRSKPFISWKNDSHTET